MTNDNPQPEVSWTVAGEPLQILDGKTLVVPRNFAFPEICLKSGATTDLVPRKQVLYWKPAKVVLLSPLLGLLCCIHPIGILVFLLLLIIVLVSVQKSSKHTYYLSRTERKKSIRWCIASGLLFLASAVAVLIALNHSDPGAYCLLALIPMIPGILLYFLKTRPLRAIRIEDDMTYIRGIPLHVMQTIVDQALDQSGATTNEPAPPKIPRGPN